MLLVKHNIPDVQKVFESGVEPHVRELQLAYRQKLDEEYVKPNPFQQQEVLCQQNLKKQ